MKDFLPTFTFGFLMAQLFPGAVTVLCLTCLYISTGGLPLEAVPTMTRLFFAVGDVWFKSTQNSVVFLFLAAATGMFLHGLDWIVLANLESIQEAGERAAVGARAADDAGVESDHMPLVVRFPQHERPLIVQLLAAPVIMLYELVLLLKARRLASVVTKDNAPYVSSDSATFYTFIQDFYLYFAQFYVHTSYALLCGLPALLWTFFRMGFTPRRGLLLALLYALMNLFFLMGRAHLGSLFRAERVMKSRTERQEQQAAEKAANKEPLRVRITRYL